MTASWLGHLRFVARLSLWPLASIAAVACNPPNDRGELDVLLRDLTVAEQRACDRQNPCPPPQRCIDGACLADNGTCDHDGDCQNDTYCRCSEASVDGGQCGEKACVPWGTPPRGAFDPDCSPGGTRAPDFVAPTSKCQWYDRDFGIRSTPLVADIDGDHVPEILGVTRTGFLVALSGKDCSVRFQEPCESTHTAHLAIADLDGDKVPEIIELSRRTNSVRVLDHAGVLLAVSPTPLRAGQGSGAPAVADIDNQPPPEIIAPGQVLRYHTGQAQLQVLWTRDVTASGEEGQLPLAADIDGDHRPEVILGRQILDGLTGADKTPPSLRALPGPPALAAVADFNSDQHPDLVLVQSISLGSVTTVSVHDLARAKVIFGPYRLQGSSLGPPLVGDVDGDGVPEIAVADKSLYRVFSLKCAGESAPAPCVDDGVLWQRPIQDVSSGITGSTMFDFNGDGTPEIVHRDECWLRIYHGRDGHTLFAASVTSSTWLETPVVADVDADGHADIVVSADSGGSEHGVCPNAPEEDTGAPFQGYIGGIFVYHGPKGGWQPTRNVWNQHSYHITNINDDLTVPAEESDNWKSFNSYRQNAALGGDARFALPDASARAAPGIDQPQQTDCDVAWTLRALLCNRGASPLPGGTPASFYRSDPRLAGTEPLCTGSSSAPIAPGSCQEIQCDWLKPTREIIDLWLRVNDDGAGAHPARECKNTNNVLQLPNASCRQVP